jgi:hypothetical protein
MRRWRGIWFCIALATSPIGAEAGRYREAEVVDAYLELRTGPGRGYPVFHVLDRGERVEILKRRTGWYKLRAADGRTGWVSGEQLTHTLVEGGAQRLFDGGSIDDFLRRRLEVGFSGGVFEGDPLLTMRLGYRATENLAAELGVSRASGDFSNTTLYAVNLVSYPFPDWRIGPFFTIGAGILENRPKVTLVGARDTRADTASVGLGVSAYVTRRFVFRAEYRGHIALIGDDRTDYYKEWSAGFAVFFF